MHRIRIKQIGTGFCMNDKTCAFGVRENLLTG